MALKGLLSAFSFLLSQNTVKHFFPLNVFPFFLIEHMERPSHPFFLWPLLAHETPKVMEQKDEAPESFLTWERTLKSKANANLKAF